MTTPAKASSNGDRPETHLTEIWDKLEAVCQRMWAEDRSSAVPLQALLEEYREEPARVELFLASQKKTISEMETTLRQEFEAENRARIEALQQELDHARAHGAAVEAELAASRKNGEELVTRLEAREAENLRLTEDLVKNEADKDAARAQRLQALYTEINHKTALVEKSWDERRLELEAEYGRKAQELRKKHEELLEGLQQRAAVVQRELDAREKQCAETEEGLRDKEEALTAHAAELENAYQQKRHDLDQLKSKLQKEIAALVKEYQAKAGGSEKGA